MDILLAGVICLAIGLPIGFFVGKSLSQKALTKLAKEAKQKAKRAIGRAG